MANYITVDGGTTNTRIHLVKEYEILDVIRLSVGARDGEAALKSALREGIFTLLSRNNLNTSCISRILASGMITSEQGLCNLVHISLPAGKRELLASCFEITFDDICEIPWCFVRGVKSEGASLADCDVMRGEETELMGLLSDCAEQTLYVLPGSHSKHIKVDGEGRITAFQTMMTGELFAAVMEHTILKYSTDFSHNQIEKDALTEGYEYCKAHGINEALFKTRILRNLRGASAETCYSFLLGVVLGDEIDAILADEETRVVLGGQKQLREAMALLLERYSDKKVVCLSDEEVTSSTARGAIRIFEA